MNQDVDLSLVSTKALIQELSRRFDHMFLVGYQWQPSKDRDYYTYYNGDPLIILGAIEAQKSWLVSSAISDDPVTGDHFVDGLNDADEGEKDGENIH